MMTLKNILTKVSQKGGVSEHKYIPLAILGLISFPLYYYVWIYFGSQGYENIHLRIVGFIICAILALKNYWPKPLKILLPFYWYFTLWYTLSFFFAFMMFNNHESNAWLLTLFSGFFLLMLLTDLMSLLIIFTLGVIIAWIIYVISASSIYFPTQFLLTLPAYITVFIAGGFFIIKDSQMQNKIKEAENLRQELEKQRLKAQFTKQAAGSIAHDLRTPLASITNFTSILKDELPEVFTGYKRARDDKLIEGRGLSDNDFSIYQESIESIQQAVDYSNHYINMILGNLKHDTIKTDSYEVFALLHVVEKALQDYPYSGKDKSLVKLNLKQDFEIWGDKFYITNIINNLLKNAFYYIKVAGKGEITIWLECKDKTNELHVKDTAKGAPKTVCDKMFEPYYSAREGGTGLGLAFCKSIMKSFKGDIKADSKEGEYMHFVFSFPKSAG